MIFAQDHAAKGWSQGLNPGCPDSEPVPSLFQVLPHGDWGDLMQWSRETAESVGSPNIPKQVTWYKVCTLFLALGGFISGPTSASRTANEKSPVLTPCFQWWPVLPGCLLGHKIFSAKIWTIQGKLEWLVTLVENRNCRAIGRCQILAPPRTHPATLAKLPNFSLPPFPHL